MMVEEWRPIFGYEGLYSVSDHGRIRRDRPSASGSVEGMNLAPVLCRGYCRVNLYDYDRVMSSKAIHRLVLHAFLGPCPEGQEVNHIDADRTNNNRPNLEYVSHSENMKHAYSLGRKRQDGEHNNHSKMTWGKVEQLRAMAATGAPLTALAEEFSIHYQTAYKIRSGKSWMGRR